MREYQLPDSSQVEQFREQGLLVLPQFYDLDEWIRPVQRGIYQIIGHVMDRHGIPDDRPPFNGDNFDSGYQQLIAMNRSWGGEIYDAVKQIPAFIRLLGHPAHEQIMQTLHPGCMPGVAAGGYGIRIDNPGEEKFRALWHQEYPAQLRSLNGIVFWSPLVPVTPELGPVQFCPGSHVEGPLPVKTTDSDGRSAAYALKLADEQAHIAKYLKISPLSSPGDLVLIDFLVLHASGVNNGDRSRWSLQFRYFDFAEPVGKSHGWKGSYASGVDFRSVHPELCAD